MNLATLSEQAAPGRLFKLAPGSVGLDASDVLEPAFDERLMSATAVISTPALDRIRDVVNPVGCNLENYKLNPTVLWEHGFAGLLPIAKSVDPQGNLTVNIEDDKVSATAFFTNSYLASEQIFSLIVAGIIKATSIRLTPLGDVRHEPAYAATIIDEWDLEEWSWVAVGCNPEAVAATVAKNRLCGKRIAEPILKSLRPFVPPKKVIVPGVDLMAASNKSATSKVKAAAKVKSDPPVDEEEEVVAEETKADETTTEEVAAEEQVDTAAAEETPAEAEQRLGAQVLMATHTALSQVLEQVDAAMGPLENESVKAALTEFIASQTEALTMIEGVYSEAYGGALKNDPPAEEQSEAEMVKSFLAAGAGSRYKLLGLNSKLQALTTAKNINASQRQTIKSVMTQLGSIVSQAKQRAAAVGGGSAKSAGQPNNTELEKTVDALLKKIDDVQPYRVVG